MKSLLILLSFLFTLTLSAQTPFTIMSSHEGKPAALSASSMNNPWVGAKLAYNLSGDVSESFLLSARALYVAAAGDKYAFPIVANVGLNNADTLSLDNGVSIGVFPWYNLGSRGNLQLLLHGGLNYHIMNKDDAGASTEFRILAGFEAALYPNDLGSPTTLSVAPEYIINTADPDNKSWGLAITGVVPIANGLGILMEGSVPFDDEARKTGVKIGVIVNSLIR